MQQVLVDGHIDFASGQTITPSKSGLLSILLHDRTTNIEHRRMNVRTRILHNRKEEIPRDCFLYIFFLFKDKRDMRSVSWKKNQHEWEKKSSYITKNVQTDLNLYRQIFTNIRARQVYIYNLRSTSSSWTFIRFGWWWWRWWCILYK